LEDCFEKIRELQDDAKHAAAVSMARIAALTLALQECLEYFKDRYDVIDGTICQRPNTEMRIGQMIDETLYGIRF
jgi:hypothetical protein